MASSLKSRKRKCLRKKEHNFSKWRKMEENEGENIGEKVASSLKFRRRKCLRKKTLDKKK